MTFEERINDDIKTAMKERRKDDLRGLRAIKQAIQLANTDGTGAVIDEAKEIQILQKLVKSRRDSLKIYEDQGREDLAETERQEIKTIEAYLPEQLSEAELEAVIASIIAETGASGMKDMGRVMGIAQGKLGGKADGKTISSMVRNLLS